MPRTLGLLPLVAVAGCLSAPALADTNVSLLPGGDFDNADQVTAWTLFNDINIGVLSWSSDDAAGSASSGSMQFDTDSLGEPTTATSPCFAIPDGGAISAGGQTRVASGGINYEFAFSCSMYSSPDCAAISHISDLQPVASAAGEWTAMTPASGTIPANARSANCTVFQQNVYSASLASVRFDTLYLTADYVFHNGFN